MDSLFRGIKSSFRKNIDELKAKREQEALEKEQYQTEMRKETQRSSFNDLREKAILHHKEKALSTIKSNNPNVRLAEKVKAINEYYKDYDRPKISNSLQELSDRSFINRYKRDMRMEKNKAIQEAVREEKLRRSQANTFKPHNSYEDAIRKIMRTHKK